MLRGGDVNEIQELRRQGLSITQIGTLTGFDRKTIRKYLGHMKRAMCCSWGRLEWAKPTWRWR